MKLTNPSNVPVYTISGSSTARPLPEWLARKRKRSLKQDPEFANRIELLQDFEFEEASACVRASDDGDWVVSTGTYKPQIHVHYLPHLSLSFARHTNALNQTFLLLSSDYSKSLHLQTDRTLEFHTPQGLYYSTRIPRYARDLKYDKHSAEALMPSVGMGSTHLGEVFRLNLEVGRFMRSYEVNVGHDETTSLGPRTLQGAIDAGSVNTAAVAEDSHNLLAFGTSLGTTEFWDSRSRSRVGLLHAPHNTSSVLDDTTSKITCLEFNSSGLTLATGSSNGLIHLYDVRSPIPFLKKDQGYGFPIQTLLFLNSTSTSSHNLPSLSDPKILSSDKRIIKIWNSQTGAPWTSVEPAVDLHSVIWCKNSGMLLTANEGRQQHSFFIPSLGPAPKWCSFLDNLVEEMAEDPDDPNAYGGAQRPTGEVYDNYKFLSMPQLRALNLDHLIGTTGLLRPYMHGYFVAQQLYEEARLISNPEIWQEQRQKSIKEKIEKERESRIRGSKKVSVKVNKRLAERALEREEKNERRKAKRAIEKASALAGSATLAEKDDDEELPEKRVSAGASLLTDARFSQLFQDEDFAVDETSKEFQSLNASTETKVTTDRKSTGLRALTAVEEEALADTLRLDSSEEELDDSDDEERYSHHRRRAANRTNNDNNKISTAEYKKSSKRSERPTQFKPRMHMTSLRGQPAKQAGQSRSFGARVRHAQRNGSGRGAGPASTGPHATVVGAKQVTFAPSSVKKAASSSNLSGRVDRQEKDKRNGVTGKSAWKERRSASGNVLRGL